MVDNPRDAAYVYRLIAVWRPLIGLPFLFVYVDAFTSTLSLFKSK